jgi:hypothetical protein
LFAWALDVSRRLVGMNSKPGNLRNNSSREIGWCRHD